MKLIPEQGRIAVQRLAPETHSNGRHGRPIALPGGSQPKNETVVVIAVCPEWRDDSGALRQSPYKPDDVLIVSKYSGEEFDLDAGRLKISLVLERDVLARLVPEPGDTHIPHVAPAAPAAAVELGAAGAAPARFDSLAGFEPVADAPEGPGPAMPGPHDGAADGPAAAMHLDPAEAAAAVARQYARNAAAKAAILARMT